MAVELSQFVKEQAQQIESLIESVVDYQVASMLELTEHAGLSGGLHGV